MREHHLIIVDVRDIEHSAQIAPHHHELGAFRVGFQWRKVDRIAHPHPLNVKNATKEKVHIQDRIAPTALDELQKNRHDLTKPPLHTMHQGNAGVLALTGHSRQHVANRQPFLQILSHEPRPLVALTQLVITAIEQFADFFLAYCCDMASKADDGRLVGVWDFRLSLSPLSNALIEIRSVRIRRGSHTSRNQLKSNTNASWHVARQVRNL